MADHEIDINLSVLSGQSGTEFQKFVSEMAALRDSLHAIAGLSPRAASTVQAAYNVGPSTPTAPDADLGGGPSSAMDAHERSQRVGEAAKRALPPRPDQMEFPVGAGGSQPPKSPYEMMAGAGDDGGRSTPPDAPKGFFGRGRDLFDRFGPRVEEMPRFGDYTHQEGLKAAAETFRKLRDASPEGSLRRGALGKVASFTQGVSDRSPLLAIAHQYGTQFRDRGIAGVQVAPSSHEDIGSRLGYSRSEDGGLGELPGIGPRLTIPGTDIGFTLPWGSEAHEAGLSRESEKVRMRSEAGINGEQAQTILDNLDQRGWSWGHEHDTIRDQMMDLTQWNPAIGQSDQTADLMDKAVRMGAHSVKEFNNVIRQVPSAAKAANVSIEQMMGSMDALGEVTQELGGTHLRGQQNAVTFSQLTGMPADILAAGMQNPYVQARGIREFGLTGDQQGVLRGGMATGNMVGAVNEMYGTMEGLFQDKYQDTPEGRILVASGKEQALARLHTYFPELDAATLRQMVDEGDKFTAGAEAEQALRQYSLNVGANKDDSDYLNAIETGEGASHDMITVDEITKKMRDTQMFSDEEIRDILHAGDGKKGADQKASAIYNEYKQRFEEKLPDIDKGEGKGGKIDLTPRAAKLVSFMEDLENGNSGSWFAKKIARSARNAGGDSSLPVEDSPGKFGFGG